MPELSQDLRPNMVKIAVTAGGGRLKAAAHFGETVWTITNWCRTARVPAAKVRALAAFSRGLVSVDQLLGYIEERHAETAGA